jgi:hypothetical protein
MNYDPEDLDLAHNTKEKNNEDADPDFKIPNPDTLPELVTSIRALVSQALQNANQPIMEQLRAINTKLDKSNNNFRNGSRPWKTRPPPAISWWIT